MNRSNKVAVQFTVWWRSYVRVKNSAVAMARGICLHIHLGLAGGGLSSLGDGRRHQDGFERLVRNTRPG